ncbi:solute carrier family 23 protein [Pseudomonas aeruginosa]|nr:solute carrier family 23 protein [Pseudomonas aeruginosa]
MTGIVITTIGLTLMPVAARWAMGAQRNHAPDFGEHGQHRPGGNHPGHRAAAEQARRRLISRLSILLAMVIGTVIAVFLGMADFSKVTEGPLVAFPRRSTSVCRPSRSPRSSSMSS